MEAHNLFVDAPGVSEEGSKRKKAKKAKKAKRAKQSDSPAEGKGAQERGDVSDSKTRQSETKQEREKRHTQPEQSNPKARDKVPGSDGTDKSNETTAAKDTRRQKKRKRAKSDEDGTAAAGSPADDGAGATKEAGGASGKKARGKGKGVKNKKVALYCKACDKFYNSEFQLQEHLGSKTHKKKMMRANKGGHAAKSPAPEDKSCTLFLGQLPFDATPEAVAAHLKTVCKGEVEVRLLTDKKQGESRGIGFADFETEEDVTLALGLHDSLFGGRRLLVERSTYVSGRRGTTS